MKFPGNMSKLMAGMVCAGGLLLLGCSPARSTSESPAVTPTQPAAASQPANTNLQIFEVKGVVQSVSPAESKVVIKHEKIPNYMEAMTMPFDVKSVQELTGLSPGDEVTFRMLVTDDDGWIENIRKTGATNALERPAVRLVRDVEPLEEGMPMPDYSFTNAFGKAIKLSDFKGQALTFTFIFTRCPFPLFCPKMNQNFETAYETLKADPAAPTNWHFISISFDPHFDTPERLNAYSKRYQPDPEKWDFATGAMVDIDAITEQFGLAIAFQNGNFDHKLRTVVVDATGKIQTIFVGNSWKVDELEAAIRQAAAAK